MVDHLREHITLKNEFNFSHTKSNPVTLSIF